MGEEYGDNNEQVLAALSLMPPGGMPKVGMQTGPQHFDVKSSPIVALAEQRAKERR
jgi:hypothetical protein